MGPRMAWTFWWSDNFLFPPGSKPRIVQPITQSLYWLCYPKFQFNVKGNSTKVHTFTCLERINEWPYDDVPLAIVSKTLKVSLHVTTDTCNVTIGSWVTSWQTHWSVTFFLNYPVCYITRHTYSWVNSLIVWKKTHYSLIACKKPYL